MSDGAVDVVIPVYNAPDAVRRCIESVYRHVGHELARVLVVDDASGPETARMLDELRLPGLSVEHAEVNTGFGGAVNRGVARAETESVLVLNSDVEAHDDFLPPLLEPLSSDQSLVVVTPVSRGIDRHDFRRYRRRSGCVPTYLLSGSAFLVRRSAWQAVGGFDPVYGRGYFEDVDLGRRLVARGGWIGIRPEAHLEHAGGASFAALGDRRELAERNRERYLQRYPEARRRVLLWTGESRYSRLGAELRKQVEDLLAAGARVDWTAEGEVDELPAVPMSGRPQGVARAALRLLRERSERSYSDLWIAGGSRGALLLAAAARVRGLAVRRLEDELG